ncbi:MAG TPA: ABC transporter permease [Sphaerochaeta sp.]|nr:ABC transporter permease [Sphaerochaeta sp.]
MIAFHIKRSAKDLIGNAILILFPLVLIFFFDYLYKTIDIQTGMEVAGQQRLTLLVIGFALTFQIYGAALSFETLSEDLYTPMHDRLFASPVEGRSLVLSVLISGTVVSFLQSLLIALFSAVVLGAHFPGLPLVLCILLVSVVFNQLLGTILLLLVGSPKVANIVTTIYGSVTPMLIGLYFPLPATAAFRFIRLYGTPVSLANTASIRAMEGNFTSMVLVMVPILIAIALLLLCLKPLVRRIAV